VSDDAADQAPTSEDDELVNALRRVAAAIDPVPDVVHAAAHAAISTRRVDTELAILVADSAGEAGADPDLDPAAAFEPVRSGAVGSQSSRLITFATDELQLDIEVTVHGDHLTLLGQVTGALIDNCLLEYASGARRELELDSLGRFMVSGAAHGAVRARIRSASGGQVMTTWVSL
jgi:hypothetical protein